MDLSHLQALFAEASRLSKHREFVVVGSLSILGVVRRSAEIPARMLVSIDVDCYTKADPERIFELKDALGQGSNPGPFPRFINKTFTRVIDFERPASQMTRIRLQGENPPRGGGRTNHRQCVHPRQAWPPDSVDAHQFSGRPALDIRLWL